ncbi:MAG TPA: GNAT family N-acetyltransferase [Oscillospiraceae bacterium]|nr:GNAT family N-acetyltransferase [Oscillospiraceae bacterium]
MITPIIETDRIILRPLKISDAEVIFKSWTSDDDVAKYVSWPKHNSIQDTIGWLKSEEKSILSETNYTFAFVLKEGNILFGSGGITYREDFGVFELGYNIMKKYWNKGLTTEAAKRIVEFAVQELKQTELLGRHADENTASEKVLKKLGFVFYNDGYFKTIDGKREIKCKNYFLKIPYKNEVLK